MAHLVDDVLTANTLLSVPCNATAKLPDATSRINSTATGLTCNREFAGAQHQVSATR